MHSHLISVFIFIESISQKFYIPYIRYFCFLHIHFQKQFLFYIGLYVLNACSALALLLHKINKSSAYRINQCFLLASSWSNSFNRIFASRGLMGLPAVPLFLSPQIFHNISLRLLDIYESTISLFRLLSPCSTALPVYSGSPCQRIFPSPYPPPIHTNIH